MGRALAPHAVVPSSNLGRALVFFQEVGKSILTPSRKCQILRIGFWHAKAIARIFLLALKLEKKIKPLGQVINSKALGRWPRALEFITWPAGLIFFPAYVLIKKILRPPGEEFYSGMASPCQNPIFWLFST